MRRNILTAWIACVFAAALTLTAQAQYTLDANYDSGSLKSYSVAGNTINLVGRDNYYDNGLGYPADSWRWLNFDATGVLNTTPTFSIRGDLVRWRRHAWSARVERTRNGLLVRQPELVLLRQQYADADADRSEGVTWCRRPSSLSRTIRRSRRTRVYVAYAIPYPYGKWLRTRKRCWHLRG